MKNPLLLPKEIVLRGLSYGASLLSDAMGRKGSMHHSIKAKSQSVRFSGTAFTVKVKPGDNYFIHKAIYTAEPGHVLVIEGHAFEENAYMGELMALAAEAKNISGIVIDGLIRDKSFIQQMELPIYARGFIPNGPFKDGYGELNSSITCGGVFTTPGDLVVGDEDGVVIVPSNQIEEVFSKAETKKNYELNRINEIDEYKKSRKNNATITDLQPPAWLK